MPIAQYVTYKCKKCGYIFTKYQSDVMIPVSCPKCKGEVEIINSTLTPPLFDNIDNIFNLIKTIFKGKK
jgi:putative FmdB family regulatory protein